MLGGRRPGVARAGEDEAFDADLRRRLRDGAGEADADAATQRILTRLAALPLPAQATSGRLRFWPSALLTGDFAPAWPRVAALAAVAALGFALGSIDLARIHERHAATPLGFSVVDGDLGGILFDDDVPDYARRR